jgi:hypothetical protein
MVKNSPGQYVKRSDVAGRTTHAASRSANAARRPGERDFSLAEIDENFYFFFRGESKPKKK